MDRVYLGEEEQELSGEKCGQSNARAVSMPTNGGDSSGWVYFMIAVIRLDLWKLLLGGVAGIMVARVYQGRWSSKFAMGFSGKV